MIWPLVQAVNFAFVPVPLQVLFVNVVGLAWGAVLSSVNADTKHVITEQAY